MLGIGQRRETHPAHAVRETLGDVVRDLERKTGLADAGRARQRQQTNLSGAQRGARGGDIEVAPQEWRGRPRKALRGHSYGVWMVERAAASWLPSPPTKRATRPCRRVV